jgi:hypothetical protein
MPDIGNRASIFAGLRIDPRFLMARMTKTVCHARHVLSGIHLALFRTDPRSRLAGMTGESHPPFASLMIFPSHFSLLTPPLFTPSPIHLTPYASRNYLHLFCVTCQASPTFLRLRQPPKTFPEYRAALHVESGSSDPIGLPSQG